MTSICRKLAVVMKYTPDPRPMMNCPAARIGTATTIGPCAAAMKMPPLELTTAAPTTGPGPKRRVAFPISRVPTRKPTLPPVKMSPSRPSPSPNWRVA